MVLQVSFDEVVAVRVINLVLDEVSYFLCCVTLRILVDLTVARIAAIFHKHHRALVGWAAFVHQDKMRVLV